MDDETTAVTHAELANLNSRKAELKKAHSEYIDQHPEIKEMLNDFMSQVLLNKPANIYAFASDHFAELSPASASSTRPSTNGHASICICGPSGVGKGTLIALLQRAYPDLFGFCVSHTTRNPRNGEVDGEHYNFTTRDAMQQEIEDSKFIEFADVHGNLYGTSFDSVQSVRSSGKICILDIDCQGVRNLKSAKSNSIPFNYVFIAPPSVDALEARLRERATEKEEDIQKRLGNAKAELEYGEGEGNFDYVVVNEVLEVAFGEVKRVMEEMYPHLKELRIKGEEKEKEEEKEERK